MDDDFKLEAFSNLRHEAYTEDPFNDMFMDMIQKFLNHMNTLDKAQLSEFHRLSRFTNDICTKLGEPAVNYSEKLLSLYKSFYDLEM